MRRIYEGFSEPDASQWDPRLAGERRAARSKRRNGIVLPCVFVLQLIVFVLYVCVFESASSLPAEVRLDPRAQEVPLERFRGMQPPSLPLPPPSLSLELPSAAAAAEPVAAEPDEVEEDEPEEDDDVKRISPSPPPPPPGTWAGLQGMCLQKLKGFWTYQLCVGGEAQQFHTTSDHGVAEQTRTVLGKYAAALDAPLTQRYTDGAVCKLTKAPREVTVLYECGGSDKLTRIEEPQPCVYEMHATVRAACQPTATSDDEQEEEPADSEPSDAPRRQPNTA